jgi:hypothetical protein
MKRKAHCAGNEATRGEFPLVEGRGRVVISRYIIAVDRPVAHRWHATFFLAATKPFANMIRIWRMGGRETLSARLSYVTYCPFLGLCAGKSHSTRLTIQPELFETHTQYDTGHRKQTIGQSICRAGQAKNNRGFTEYGVLFLWGRRVGVYELKEECK